MASPTQIMKRVFQALVLSGLTALCFAKLNGQTSATSLFSVEIAQTLPSASQKVLEVSIPESTTVLLNTGGSSTGELTNFTPDELTLSVDGFSQSFPLDQIQKVEFRGNVWIVDVDGQRVARRLRGWPVPIAGVPINTFELDIASELARMNLDNILSDSEFSKYADDPENTYAVTKIVFESSATMEVSIKAVGR